MQALAAHTRSITMQGEGGSRAVSVAGYADSSQLALARCVAHAFLRVPLRLDSSAILWCAEQSLLRNSPDL
jgi:hypothetical protein